MTVDDSEFRDASEHYKQLATFWTDILHLMSSKPGALASVGPMRALAANSKKITNEMIEMSEDMVTFSKHLTEYYSQLADTWGGAQKKVNQKMSDIPQDVEQIEALKRVWIDMFDNDFTELFDSPKFGSNYGKLVSKELEIVKHWNNISNTVLQSANLPSKEEIDDVYREIHSLKKRLRLSELELQRLRRAGSSAASKGVSDSAPATGVDNVPSDPERGDTPAKPAASVVAGDGGKLQPQDVQEMSQSTQHRPQHQPPQQPRGVRAQPPRQASQPPAPSRPRDTAPSGGPAEGPAPREPESGLPSSKPDSVSSPSAPSPPDQPGVPPSAQNAKNPRRRRRRPRRRLSKSGRPGGPNPPSMQPESAPKPAPVPSSPKDAHTAAVAQHAPDASSGSLSRPPQDAAKRAGTAPGGAAGAPEAAAKKKRRRRHRPDRHTRRMQQQQQQQQPQQQGQSRPSQPQPAADTRPAPSQEPQDVQNPENTNDSGRRTRDASGDSARQNPPSSKPGTAADGGLPRKDGDTET